MNLNVSPMDSISNDDGDQSHKPFGSNNQVISSLSPPSVACHISFNQTQDQTGYCQHQLYQYQVDDTYASQGGSAGSGSSCEMKNTVENSGFKSSQESEKNIKYGVKWMSSKIRLMQRMKNPDLFPLKITSNIDVTTNLEDHNIHPISSSLEIDLTNSNSSYNNNNNSSSSSCPIRVCSDCNTTKTPLWRSGPKGPKSLCNACGIRQRKARRAMAAAAAAAVSTVVSSTTDQPSAMKNKVQQKDKTTAKNGNVTQLKKRYKMAASAGRGGGGGGSPSNVLQKKLGFEDFLINLSENLKFHRVFPDDEKDAAILLMALSSGLVHG